MATAAGVTIVFSDGTQLSLSLPSHPVALWNVNPYCNLECGYCYGSFGGKSFKTTGRRPPTLSGADLGRVASTLRDLGVVRTYLGGGEPLLRRDFTELVQALRSADIEVMVTTNLTVLPDRVVSLFSTGALSRLTVSLDSLDAAYNDRVRGGTARVLRHLDRLTAIAGSQPDASELGIYCVVTRANLDDAEELLGWAAAHDVGYFSYQPVALPVSHPLFSTLSLSPEHAPRLRCLFDQLRDARQHLQTSGDVYLRIWEKLLDQPGAVVTPCPAGRFLFYVSETGEVWRCPAYDIVAREPAMFDTRQPPSDRAEIPAPQDCSYLSFDCLCMWELMYPMSRST